MIGPDTISTDTFFDGRLRVYQTRNGYRFSIDAVLLAGSVRPKAGQSVVDLGTGCGIISLMLAVRYPDADIKGVEVQGELAQLTEMNIQANGLQDRIRLIHKDIRDITEEDIETPADWVVANPPYRRPSSGRINPENQKALARHEIVLNLFQLLQACKRLLKTRGRFAIIYPADRMTELLCAMCNAGIEPKWLQSVHSYAGVPARLVMVQGVKAGKPGIQIVAPLVIYQRDGRYTPDLLKLFELHL